MKTYLPSTLIGLFLAAPVFAGPAMEKNVIIPVDPSCPCFTPGLNIGGFAAGYLPSSGDQDGLGGGVSFAYYFTERIGVDLSYAVHGTDPEKHVTALDLVYRVPLGSSCWAPYLLTGGAVYSNGENQGGFRVGGGLEYRMGNCSALFADGTYNWVNDEPNATTVRLGLRIPF